MDEPREKSIEELFDEITPIENALKKGVREALIRHKKLGQPIVVWKDSKVVWIPAEEIEVSEPPEEG